MRILIKFKLEMKESILMKPDKRILSIMVIDAVLINLAVFVSYFMRLGKMLSMEHIRFYLSMAVMVTFIKLCVFYAMGVYRIIWKYAGIDDIVTVFLAVCIANGIIIVIIYLREMTQVPRSIYLICTLVDFIFIVGSRFSKYIIRHFLNKENIFYHKGKRVMIIGAGEAGGLIIQQIRNNFVNLKPICIIDDNKAKKGRRLNGVPIVGNRNDIPYICEKKKIEQIIIAIPSIKREQLTGIVEKCQKTKCELKIVPFIDQIQNLGGNNAKEKLVEKIRNVDIEDLLGRDEVILENKGLEKYIKDKVILVTGGGGSIGSELCRQIARYNPQRLVILDIYENNAYDIQNELLANYPNVELKVVIASIRDRERIEEIFEKYMPNIVFHAAAHKHVPLMEGSPREAIKNNVFGTLNLVRAAHEFSVEKFVQISTDKAVNPTNVMGASKRLCEMINQAYAQFSKTSFVAVRFGNVLGSNGSVIPLFKKQIAAGGPVRVTHPDIIRYFMTITEAVQLVLEAGAIAKGGEIFVLDMGKPVKIDKLARDLIRLSGLEPDKDIKIEYVGLRPGEKLYEELLMAEEGINKTSHDKIYIARPMNISIDILNQKLELLKDALDKSDEQMIKVIKEVVPTYRQAE